MNFFTGSALLFLLVGILGAESQPPNLITGGWNDNRDVNDPIVQEMAAFAAQEMGLELQEVLAAEYQVVAGFNYKIEMVLKWPGNSDFNKCTMVVHSGLMNEGKELTEIHECSPL